MPPTFSTDNNPHGRLAYTCTHPNGHSSITIYQQGAHVTSWRTNHSADGAEPVWREHLYMSPSAVFKDGKALRGGVPLIFPQFSDLGPLPVSHGFLRTCTRWEIVEETQRPTVSPAEEAREGGEPAAVLTLSCVIKDGVEPLVPEAALRLVYEIAFNRSALHLQMQVTNDAAATAPFVFGFAYHSYFTVPQIEAVRVHGLSHTPYLDDLQDRKRCEPEKVEHIHEEIDRIYIDQHNKPIQLELAETPGQSGHVDHLVVHGEQLRDTVLWNPWVEKTKGMSDMPEDGYKYFVCVESGNILEKTTLAPGATWTGSQCIHYKVASSS
ncbi:glucose-6-phosphate 1-epimerase [Strigomonas culicis]|uniref:glucose-6-phosphate 1-epimerase n=1 Tax=Strigomonas culicis TaxID=28005 RepID=S9VMP6_9TRYP|nr:glucose-6-phosphate 1-epimerase [Strigomonas culicis]|eukprot:EPY24510.1 glucose-6-phosphate 1-epimerase [Strigomonas culicis]